MRKQLLLITLISISCLTSYAQIVFENGYFINESNQKIECLIKNIDWKNNPTNFEYKRSDNDAVQKGTIQTVKEFGIDHVSKYIRAKTNIDRSSNMVGKLSSDSNPHFEEELLFLKVLIEGQASLFSYSDNNLTRYFYRLDDGEIQQLVYKRYLIVDRISENNSFRSQLFLMLKCEELVLNDIENLSYSKRELEKLFIRYNECTRSEYIKYEPKRKKDLFNLTLRPGLNYSSLKIQNSITDIDIRDTDFGNKLGIRLGLEAEFILPYNKNKWGILVEPTYQYFKSVQAKETDNISGGTLVSKVDYKSIELPLGVRHHFYLNDKSKVFANISYVIDLSYDSSFKFLSNDDSIVSELDVKSGNNLAFGIGYMHKNRYSLEIRYNTSRHILGSYSYWNSDYRTASVMVGYSLF